MLLLPPPQPSSLCLSSFAVPLTGFRLALKRPFFPSPLHEGREGSPKSRARFHQLASSTFPSNLDILILFHCSNPWSQFSSAAAASPADPYGSVTAAAAAAAQYSSFYGAAAAARNGASSSSALGQYGSTSPSSPACQASYGYPSQYGALTISKEILPFLMIFYVDMPFTADSASPTASSFWPHYRPPPPPTTSTMEREEGSSFGEGNNIWNGRCNNISRSC